uniref:Uncharacterized protein n=1 Tax=Micrurus surinamensis TaxID=129470 RepID=A0A2D4P8G4_MICSU
MYLSKVQQKPKQSVYLISGGFQIFLPSVLWVWLGGHFVQLAEGLLLTFSCNPALSLCLQQLTGEPWEVPAADHRSKLVHSQMFSGATGSAKPDRTGRIPPLYLIFIGHIFTQKYA